MDAVRCTVVHLVRHAATPTTGKRLPGRATGLHLSAAGRRQAADLARQAPRLFGDVAACYSSPLERALETASPIASGLGLDVLVDDELAETDVGTWTGRTLASLRRSKAWAALCARPSTFRFPGGESFADLYARVSRALNRLVEQHRGETILVVSHADPIKVALLDALGLHLDNLGRIAVEPGSVSTIEFGSGPPLVRRLGVLALSTNDAGSTPGGGTP
ncbi:MAG: phosphoglycerate mutase [Acidimicrobiales bacterium]|nr:MAG: phosphoglycerate mutase [Acidimicrobiales bacterium]